jgi:hypothetical protein
MERYQWSKLNKQQVGAYVEYFVKMEFTMHGFQVYNTEVDDRGVDFVARHERGPFIEVQVKSVRTANYIYMPKAHFHLSKERYLALGLLKELQAPALYLIPSTVWLEPNGYFMSRDYAGLKSNPEWGLSLSKKNLPALKEFEFGASVDRLLHSGL